MITDWVRLPVALFQGAYLRATVPRLAPPKDPIETQCGDLDSPRQLELLCIGESTIAGCGAEQSAETLPARFASILAGRLEARVSWRTRGQYGARARDCLNWCDELLPMQHELALIVLGVNDTLRFTAAARWREDLRRLIQRTARGGISQVILAGVPPMGRFPALTGPLRQVLGERSAQLDQVSREVCEGFGALHVPMPEQLLDTETDALFARDRFHPSALGYQRWAEGLADQLEESGHGLFG